MQARTTPPDEPVAVGDAAVVDREVETVRTRERVAGPGPAGAPVAGALPVERSGRYFETLPERMRAVAVVMLTALEGLLGIRFLLLAFGANPSSGFFKFIDNTSWPFVAPFANVLNDRTWDQGVVEISTLVGMSFYLLVFALIGMLVTALAPRLNGDTGGAA